MNSKIRSPKSELQSQFTMCIFNYCHVGRIIPPTEMQWCRWKNSLYGVVFPLFLGQLEFCSMARPAFEATTRRFFDINGELQLPSNVCLVNMFRRKVRPEFLFYLVISKFSKIKPFSHVFGGADSVFGISWVLTNHKKFYKCAEVKIFIFFHFITFLAR